MQEKNLEGFRLSPQQRRLWSLAQGGPLNAARCAVLVEGDAEPKILREALRQVVARHEILRTTFRRRPGMKFPLQVVGNSVPHLKEIELTTLDASAQNQHLEELFREAARPAADAEESPLRLTLVKLSDSRRVLVVSLPALSADTRTLENFVSELSVAYGALARGGETAEEPAQYADYCQWQTELVEAGDEDAAAGLAFWQAREGVLSAAAPALPLENRAAAQSAAEPEMLAPLALDAETVARAESAAVKAGAPIEVFLLACWQTLLGRLTNQTPVVVRHTFDGRTLEELRDALGLFARALPLSADFGQDAAFTDILDETRRSVEETAAWQDYFAATADGATSETDGSSVVFEFSALAPAPPAGGVSFSIFKRDANVEPFKLKLSCVRAAENVFAELAYDAARVTREEAERVARSFVALVESASANPSAKVKRLNVLCDDDRRQLVNDFNRDTARELPDACVQQLFEAQAARHPDRPAVVSEEQSFTYAELNARSNRLARRLRRLGVGADTLVGLCVERSAETLTGLLGVLKSGGAYVALDSDNPAARLAQQVSATGLKVLVTQERFLPNFPDFDGQILCLDRDRRLLEAEPQTNLESVTAAQNLAYVIFTSGSTGTPKGVGVTHGGISNYTRFISDKLARHEQANDERALSFAIVSTFTADLGHTCLYPSLTSGGTLHVISYEAATDAARFASYVAENPIDVLKITPSHLGALLSLPRGAEILPRQFLFTGGEALTRALVERVRESRPGCRVFNHYGPTETTVGSLTYDLTNDDGRGASSSVVPIGRPADNTRAYVLNENFEPSPVGVPGDLYVAGAGLARGYVNQPAQTAERFVPDAFSATPGARMYKTGDVARYLADGNVEFLGRSDHQVKIRGFRVELGEIEAALRSHASVRDAAVLVEEDAASGHKRLVAYAVAAERDARAAGELRAHLKSRLPEYMMPAAFVLLEALPLTPNGKVDRAALKALGARPVPATDESGGEASNVAPRNSAEEVLTNIWKAVLGLERVGPDDNFFELGGDSILGIQIIARANEAGFQLTPKQLFQHQTIAELVAASGTTPGAAAHEQGTVTGDVPLTPLQQWFFERELAHPELLSQAMLYEVGASLDAGALATATRRLFEHHDALRLRFVKEENGWRQFNAATEDGHVFMREDLSLLTDDEQRARVEQAAAELRAGIDLASGPLARVALFQCGANRPDRLLIVCHYLAVDGFSWRVLLEDLQTAYQQLTAGGDVSLPSKTTSFKSWAERVALDAESEDVRGELSYWLDESRARAPRLPVDDPNGDNTEASVRTVSTSLDEDETEALLREVPAAYHTEIDDALLTALARAAARWTGEGAPLVDLESHGRADARLEEDLSRTVGRVTHRAPLSLDAAEFDDPGDALKSVKEQLRRFRASALSYGLLRYLSADPATRESLRALPPAEIYFNYVGQLDQAASSLFPVESAPEVLAHDRRVVGQRTHLLDVSAMIFGGRLQLLWEFSPNVHRRETVERLAADFTEELRALIEHCRSADAGGYTPSDFPEMNFDQQELDDLMAKLGA